MIERLGAILAGRYSVERELGRGGMATVYLAEDLRHRRRVAIKVLSPELSHALGPDRFLREIELTAALDHPHIVPLLDSGEADGLLYYVMPYVEGESLRDRLIREKQLPLEDALRIAREVSDALGYAHSHGIVHRDIKPENIVLSGAHARVLDFGIARAVTTADRESLTATGLAVGTMAYMSPEQATGGRDVDARTDVYGLGCVLYEMLIGEPPFTGATAEAVLARKVLEPVPSLRVVRQSVTAGVEVAVTKALARAPADRFATTSQFVEALDRASNTPPREPASARWTALPRLIAAGLAVAIVGGIAWWAAAAGARTDRARAAPTETWARAVGMPEVARLVGEAKLDSAWIVGSRVGMVLGGDPAFGSLRNGFGGNFTITTEPAGADIEYRLPGHDDLEWTLAGTTPLERVWLPRAVLHVRITREAHEAVELLSPASTLAARPVVLDTAGTVPVGMVRAPSGPAPVLDAIPEGVVTLFSPNLGHVAPVPLAPFFIGRHEVSNGEYQQFVDAGGYRSPEWWPETMVVNGRVVTRDTALASFVDRTGRPGPSAWVAGRHPQGDANHPVGGLSWYEASAYAQFAGAALATIHHWHHAAGTVLAASIIPGSNLAGRGPRPVGEPGGLGPFGTYDMAGNVREWVANATPDGWRYAMGGGWDDPPYLFNWAVALPPDDRSAANGVRLATFTPGDDLSAALAPLAMPHRDLAADRPVSDEVFAAYRQLYSYDPRPLDARIEVTDTSATDWILEIATFDAGYDAERMEALVFIPRVGRRPYQAILLYPGSQTLYIPAHRGSPLAHEFYMQSGRLMVIPILKGMFGRGAGTVSNRPEPTAAYRDNVVTWMREVRRTVDYLVSRDDVDAERIGYAGSSWGAAIGPVALALEPRFRAAVLGGGGLWLKSLPEADAFHFAPRVRAPTLMLNGRYDWIYPLETAQRPLFELLGAPPARKRHLLYETAHSLPRIARIRESLAWFDRYLGEP